MEDVLEHLKSSHGEGKSNKEDEVEDAEFDLTQLAQERKVVL